MQPGGGKLEKISFKQSQNRSFTGLDECCRIVAGFVKGLFVNWVYFQQCIREYLSSDEFGRHSQFA